MPYQDQQEARPILISQGLVPSASDNEEKEL